MSLSDLKHILDRPVWSKDVVIWIGSVEKLNELLEAHNTIRLDMLDILPDDELLPSSREERAELIRRALDERVQSEGARVASRTILLVKNAAILARYGVGLQPFYDWFAGTRTMTILHVDRIRKIELPETVDGAIEFNPDSLSNYFKPLLGNPRNLCVEAS